MIGAFRLGAIAAAVRRAFDPNFDPYLDQVTLLLHFDGADASTAIADSSPAPITVTAGGNAQIDTALAKFGGAALLLDGTGDYALAASSAGLALGSGDFTIEGWIYPQATANQYPTIIERGGAWGANEWSIAADHASAPGKYSVWIYAKSTSSPAIASASAIAYDAWHHFALVRSGSTISLYIDGVLEGSTTLAGAMTGATSEQMRIGNGFLGSIDELRVTKGAARYTAAFTPPAAPFPDA